MVRDELSSGKKKLAVIGLGYVGLPLAVAFAKETEVIGFDLNKRKIEQYRLGHDVTKEVGDEQIKETKVVFTDQEEEIQEAGFIIVAVPTPVKEDKTPELLPVKCACEIVARNMPKGAIVVFESTVYPGVTEDICGPILERGSSMVCGKDFFVGYSPERINPGDVVHKVQNICKIVSGQNDQIRDEIAAVYEMIVTAGVYKAKTIKVAEAAKLAENTQRDINIAFMNELAMSFEKMGISSYDVIDAMNTKWNALGFTPGLVGGHCIGVDPYYFIYEAAKFNYNSPFISAGRKINNEMGRFIADLTIKLMVRANKRINRATVGILGITFKEDCPDIRNTRVMDIIERLREYEVTTVIVDPVADKEDLYQEYQITTVPLENLSGVDGVIVAVAHSSFKDITLEELDHFYRESPDEKKVLVDVKRAFCAEHFEKNDQYIYKSL